MLLELLLGALLAAGSVWYVLRPLLPSEGGREAPVTDRGGTSGSRNGSMDGASS
jgi:hypothetical protein